MKKTVQKKMGGGILGALAGGDSAIPLMGILPVAYNAYQKKQKAKASAEDSDEQKAVAAVRRNREIMNAASARGAKPMAKGGKVSRGDGCCVRGKTKGKMC